MSNKKHDDRAHSEYSASGSHRWVHCAASISLCRDAPKMPDHPAGVEGTLTHECLAALNTNNGEGIYAVMDRLLKVHPLERVKRAEKAYWQIQKMREKFPGADFHAETKVDTSHFTEKGNFGTVDAAIVEHFGTLTITDYKNGVMPVDPKENTQGICYALGFAKMHDYNFHQVDICILQPNSRVASRTVSNWTISMKALTKWEEFLREAVRKTKAKNPPCTAGEWCYFCPAKNFNCPLHAKKALMRAQDDFAEVEPEFDFTVAKN